MKDEDIIKQILHFSAKESFILISKKDQRVVRGKSDGYVEMWTRDETDPNQLWVASDYGQQFINVGTNLPLQAGEGKSWIWDGKYLVDARNTNMVMTVQYWLWLKDEDGANVLTFEKFGCNIQMFEMKTEALLTLK